MAGFGTYYASIPRPCAHLICVTVVYLYDYLITFPKEATCFWKARPTGATVLFFLTRYLTMTVFLLEFAYGFVIFTGSVSSSAVQAHAKLADGMCYRGACL